MITEPADLARAQGLFNVISGLWPLVSRRSFEAVFGRKHDDWLMHTVSGLLIANGWVQLRAADTAEGQHHARRIGFGTAATLLAIDLVYAPTGRIPRTYLLDAAVEAGWLLAWSRTANRRPARQR
jgi:hypothetical protein